LGQKAHWHASWLLSWLHHLLHLVLHFSQLLQDALFGIMALTQVAALKGFPCHLHIPINLTEFTFKRKGLKPLTMFLEEGLKQFPEALLFLTLPLVVLLAPLPKELSAPLIQGLLHLMQQVADSSKKTVCLAMKGQALEILFQDRRHMAFMKSKLPLQGRGHAVRPVLGLLPL
jgi:hypothetical protein